MTDLTTLSGVKLPHLPGRFTICRLFLPVLTSHALRDYHHPTGPGSVPRSFVCLCLAHVVVMFLVLLLLNSSSYCMLPLSFLLLSGHEVYKGMLVMTLWRANSRRGMGDSHHEAQGLTWEGTVRLPRGLYGSLVPKRNQTIKVWYQIC